MKLHLLFNLLFINNLENHYLNSKINSTNTKLLQESYDNLHFYYHGIAVSKCPQKC